MKTDEIKLWFEYNYWANGRILATSRQISEEQYTAFAGFGSVRAALVHVLDSEWIWRLLCQSVPISDGQALTETELPTLHALETRWRAEEQEMRAFLGSLQDSDLDGVIRYPIDNGIIRERVLWHCLLHVVNHGTQHRSEAAALLTSYGQSPGGLDFTVFLNEYFQLPS